MQRFVFCALFLLFYLENGYAKDDIDALIEEVFGGNTTSEENVSSNSSCQCVPYYLCITPPTPDPGITIETDPAPCSDYLEVCCKPSDITNDTSILDNVTDLSKVIEETTSNSSVPCQCVPYYLCQANDTVSIGEKECSSYLDVCCSNIMQADEPITSANSKISISAECGKRNMEGELFSTIEQENASKYGEFPWMMAILQHLSGYKTYRCGGSLIHPQVVLTSAHCVLSASDNLLVRAGEWDASTKREFHPHLDVKVSSIIVHPHYGGELVNNIALLILETPLEKSPVVNTICLPEAKEMSDASKCVLSGWGKNEKNGKYQTILKKLELPLVTKDACQERLKKTSLGGKFELGDGLICAGGEGKQDACTGDQGDPLICEIPGRADQYFQIGIFSWGIGCGENNIPKVYTDVTRFKDWIEIELVALNYNTSSYKYL